MADVFSKKKRSEIMSRIRGKDTGPEKRLKSALRRAKISYRGHLKLPGTPDVAFPVYKIAVFCDGAFWHGHDFGKRKLAPFWKKKIEANIARDKRVNRQLRRLGWKVLRFWDFQIDKSTEKCLKKIRTALESRNLDH